MRTEALSEEEVWGLGDGTAGGHTGRLTRARGDFTARHVKKQGNYEDWQLRVRPDAPPDRHAVIVGWPTQSNKKARKAIAMKLRRVPLTVRPNTDLS